MTQSRFGSSNNNVLKIVGTNFEKSFAIEKGIKSNF